MRLIGLATIVALLATSPISASEPLQGRFTATQACEVFQSFRRQTNPGDVRLTPGMIYTALETNQRSNPVSIRIRVDDASPPKRWTELGCGLLDPVPSPIPDRPDNANTSCRTPGLADSYVLALSWQPAFCETRPQKPECSVRDPQSFQANHFTLHGLWPNKHSCGTSYGMCDRAVARRSAFCDYPALALSPTTREQLEVRMPSAKHGSCLQRHEWYKHGTCQTTMDVDAYYQISIRLTDQFNDSGVAAFMASHIGREVRTADFLAIFDQAYGENGHRALTLKCQRNQLVDVYVHLKHPVTTSARLSDLIAHQGRQLTNRCGESFFVDAITD